MTTYAIGDLQGCHAELCELLALVGFSRANDRLWLVGDLVNRGPASLAVLREVRALGDAAVTVLGNHDLHLLTVAAGHRRPHRGDTIDDILAAPDRDELLDWLARQPLVHVEDEWLMVHAGLLPSWTPATARMLSREVSAVLQGPGASAFLRDLYGDEPRTWRDDLAGVERLRAIVNVCTRLRFCTADDTMEFREKRGAAHAPPGFLPWFAQPGRRSAHVNVVCGHWSTLDLMLRPNVMMLDSGCVWGGPLTAMRLSDRRLYQVGGRASVSPKPAD
jgi:bis(5'-nucleosyl)-tetraphosphatase (symmetrical)